MKQSHGLRIVVGFLALALLAGCSKNPATTDTSSDDAAIRQLVDDNIDYITNAGINDDGAQPIEYNYESLSKTSEMISPLKFGRRGEFHLESITVEYPDPELAVATIIHSFNGKFVILAADTTDTIAAGKLYSKDMKNTIVRRAIFKKIADTPNPRQNWRLRRISASETQSPTTTISFDWVKIQTTAGQEWILDSPFTFVQDLDSIPTFDFRDSVKIFVKVNNSFPYLQKPGETVILRYRNDRGLHRARKGFNDEGFYPDVTAGDGIYSGWWVVSQHRGIFHTFVDAIDNGTIYDDRLPYNSLIWGFPYRVK